jgi:hypothetical protein
MSEVDDTPAYEITTPSASASRVRLEVALARMEGKLDVAISTHSTRLDEHSRQIGELGATANRYGERIGTVEQALAANSAREASEMASRATGLTRTQLVGLWLALSVSVVGTMAKIVVDLIHT